MYAELQLSLGIPVLLSGCGLVSNADTVTNVDLDCSQTEHKLYRAGSTQIKPVQMVLLLICKTRLIPCKASLSAIFLSYWFLSHSTAVRHLCLNSQNVCVVSRLLHITLNQQTFITIPNNKQ